MNAKTVELINMMQNADLYEAFSKQTTPEGAAAFLKANGLDVTVQELAAMKEELSAADKKQGELSEDDLESVAGGVNWWKIVHGVIDVFWGIFG